jgi:hypothetical protein
VDQAQEAAAGDDGAVGDVAGEAAVNLELSLKVSASQRAA